jgi:TolB protein
MTRWEKCVDLTERPSDPIPRKLAAATTAFALASTGIAVAVWAFLGGTTPESEGLEPNGPIVFLGTGTNSGLGVDNMEIYATVLETGKTFNLTNSPAEEREPAWSRQGTGVAFTRTSLDETTSGKLAAHKGIFVMDASGSREVLPCGSDFCKEHGVVLSPDGSTIAYVRSDSIWLADVGGGAERQVCTAAECGDYLYQIAWSPRGSAITFAQSAPRHGLGVDPSGILVGDIDNGTVKELTNTGCSLQDREGNCTFDHSPQWSPDGGMIAFGRSPTQQSKERDAVYVMRADGTNVRRVTACKDPCQFVWAPDGKQIAVREYFQPTIRVVDIVERNETILRACRDKPCREPYELAWSPDGTKIAFLAGEGGTTALYVADADATASERVDTLESAHCCLAWLPGTPKVASMMSSALEASLPGRPAAESPPSSAGLLVFTGDPSGGNEDETEVYSARTDGTDLTQLTSSPSFRFANSYPSWSSDGSQIYFYRQSFGDRPSKMFVMAADGSDQHPLRTPVHGAISPDQSEVVFTEQYGEDGYGSIFVINVDGTGRRAVTDPPAREMHADPVWSPDGSRILFERQTEEGNDLAVVNVDGGGLLQITDLPGNEQGAAWSPDGSQIAFGWWTTAGSDIYVVNSDGTGLRRLTDLAGYAGSPDWSPDGRTIVFDGENLLDGDEYHQGIYTIGTDGTGLFQVTPSGNTIFWQPAWQPSP